eukprot:evm.model.scf_89.5 EVM.evm.TU.scf_89.5   scf_89:14842-15879(-)
MPSCLEGHPKAYAGASMEFIAQVLAQQEALNYDTLVKLGLLKDVVKRAPPNQGETERRAVHSQSCTIPLHMVQRLVEGEGSRGSTVIRSHRKANEQGQAAKRAKRSNPTPHPHEVLDKVEYYCKYGGAIQKKKLAPAREGIKRRNRVSKKTGCRFRFTATRYAGDPTNIIINYREPSHIDAAGQPCHGPELMEKEAKKRKRTYIPKRSAREIAMASCLPHSSHPYAADQDSAIADAPSCGSQPCVAAEAPEPIDAQPPGNQPVATAQDACVTNGQPSDGQACIAHAQELCARLLVKMEAHPALARHVFAGLQALEARLDTTTGRLEALELMARPLKRRQTALGFQ